MLPWPSIPTPPRRPLEQRLRVRARERWPQITSLQIRHRGVFSYIHATLTDASTLKLCRLRYVGSASQWQFAVYRVSHDDYDESIFFTGLPIGTCQDALDTACGLYLNDPTAWAQHPTNLRARPLSRRNRGDLRGAGVDRRARRRAKSRHQPHRAGRRLRGRQAHAAVCMGSPDGDKAAGQRKVICVRGGTRNLRTCLRSLVS
jgi:hypothetical protein